MGRLDEVDLTKTLTRKEESRLLKQAWTRLQLLRLSLGGHLENDMGPGLTVVFEGWDAAGKGGCIKRLVYPMDPRHVTVMQYAAPTDREKRHHFLWRFWPVLPGWGGMVCYDRSWYGRVLVERIEGFCSETEWRRAYREISEFERGLTEEGMILVKFWLHLSPEEQLARFIRRANDPLKSWKLTDEDWRNRDKRHEYEAAIEDMLTLTDHADAPWFVIPSESKRYARVQVCQTVIREIEKGMRRWGHELPPRYLELKAEHDPSSLIPDEVLETLDSDVLGDAHRAEAEGGGEAASQADAPTDSA